MKKRPTKILYEVCIASETNPGGIASHNSYDSEEDDVFVIDGDKEDEVEGEVSGSDDDVDGTCAIDTDSVLQEFVEWLGSLEGSWEDRFLYSTTDESGFGGT